MCFLLHTKIQKARLFCDAHLNEGHCFPCHYTLEDIYLEGDELRTGRKGRCEDFELL